MSWVIITSAASEQFGSLGAHADSEGTKDGVSSYFVRVVRAITLVAPSPMKETRDPSKLRPNSARTAVDEPSRPSVPGIAPIKTPDPTDADPSAQPDEVPKVGSKDAPGG